VDAGEGRSGGARAVGFEGVGGHGWCRSDARRVGRTRRVSLAPDERGSGGWRMEGGWPASVLTWGRIRARIHPPGRQEQAFVQGEEGEDRQEGVRGDLTAARLCWTSAERLTR
jgi:hypothetical protein